MAHECQRDGLVKLLHRLSGRIVKLLERRGLILADEAHPSLDMEAGSSLDQLQAVPISYRIAIGSQAGRKAVTPSCLTTSAMVLPCPCRTSASRSLRIIVSGGVSFAGHDPVLLSVENTNLKTGPVFSG